MMSKERAERGEIGNRDAELDLLRATKSATFIFFGGEVRRPKLARLRKQTGLHIEWLGGKDAARLLWRVRGGKVAGVVLLDGLLGHSASAPVLRALRRGGISHAYAGRGGLRGLLDALVKLQSDLLGTPAPRPSSNQGANQ